MEASGKNLDKRSLASIVPISSSRGNSDGGVERLKLRNTISDLGSLGAIISRRRISRAGLRVCFFINTDATGRAGLKISSKLPALAKVRDSPSGKS